MKTSTFFTLVPSFDAMALTEKQKGGIDWYQLRNKEKTISVKLLGINKDGKIKEYARFCSYWSKSSNATTCYSYLTLSTDNSIIGLDSKAGGYGYDKNCSNLYSILHTLGFKMTESGQYEPYNVLQAIGIEVFGLTVESIYICQG